MPRSLDHKRVYTHNFRLTQETAPWPENVRPVVRGDVIEMHIDGLPNLSVKIV